MRLGEYLTSLTKSELDEVRELLNLTDDELKVFNELSKGRSIITIADRCGMSTTTVSNKIKTISIKIARI